MISGELVKLHYLNRPVELREAQLILLDIVVYEPDLLPVIIVIPVYHDLRRGMMLSHALVSLQ